MANLKNITDLPVAESAEGLNLIVNDNGAAKQISAKNVGASSWNDLKDKPFYEETSIATIIDNQIFDFSKDGAMRYAHATYEELNISAGDVLTVIYDGVEYPNIVVTGDEATGFEFEFKDTSTDGIINFLYYNKLFEIYVAKDKDTTQHTISVLKAIETIRTIDPKYLPKGGSGYTETETVVVLEETTFTEFTNGLAIFTTSVATEGDKEYTVVWNGAEYVCTSIALDDPPVVLLGNLGAAGGENTGEPFMIATEDGITHQFAPLDDSKTVTMSITAEKETVHKIDTKYLPDGVDAVITVAEGWEGSISPKSLSFAMGSPEDIVAKCRNGEFPCIRVIAVYESEGDQYADGCTAISVSIAWDDTIIMSFIQRDRLYIVMYKDGTWTVKASDHTLIDVTA